MNFQDRMLSASVQGRFSTPGAIYRCAFSCKSERYNEKETYCSYKVWILHHNG